MLQLQTIKTGSTSKLRFVNLFVNNSIYSLKTRIKHQIYTILKTKNNLCVERIDLFV